MSIRQGSAFLNQRRRRTVTNCAFLLLIMPAAFLFPACQSGSNSPQDRASDATVAATAAASATASPPPEIALVGRHDLGGEGGADVWANGDIAYVGARCRRGGVKIVDVADPQDPQLAGIAADHAATSAEDVMVIDARTRYFEGELMAVGLQSCPNEDGELGLQGLELWDATDPAQPEPLGFFDVGPLPSGGVHELYLFQRQDRLLALLAVPFSEVFHPDGLGDLRIVEVTDPRNPVQLADWGAGKDGGLAFGSFSYESVVHGEHAPGELEPHSYCTPPPGEEPLCRGDIPWVIGHSASANKDGSRAFVSYWDAGMMILDISEPSRPVLLGRAREPTGDEGNVHSAVSVPGKEIAITTDEDFVHAGEAEGPPGSTTDPGDRWGYVRVWDISDPEQPQQIGSFETPHSASSRRGGLFTVHNPEVHGDLLYLSWYSDGLRVLDISKPALPREVASFVPPPSERVAGEPSPALVWGVHVEGDLIFLSDMNAGLYVVKMTR